MESLIHPWATLQIMISMEIILRRPRLLGEMTLSVQMMTTCRRCLQHQASRQMMITRLGRRTVHLGHAGHAHQKGQLVRHQPLLLAGAAEAAVAQIMEEALAMTMKRYRRRAEALGVALQRVVKL